jgi:ABC-2 type transport system ATP-binding protein
MNAVVLEARGLGRRYGRTRWGLQGCDLSIPAGRVTALVGSNGAGKTTLLYLAAGLLRPTTGALTVLGHRPQQDQAHLLPDLGFVAQDRPLYRQFRVAEMMRMGRALNARWDDAVFAARMASLGIPLSDRVGSLSAGQQAQVSLAMTIAKQPRLLLLDEPVAALDPLARREFLDTLRDGVEHLELSVVLSSHLVDDIERACDYLVLLAASRVRVSGDIGQLLAEHRLVDGPVDQVAAIEQRHTVISQATARGRVTLVVRTNGQIDNTGVETTPVSLEELIIAYMRSPQTAASTSAEIAAADRMRTT